MKIKKINKAVWIGAIVGGVYSLIPAIQSGVMYTTSLFLPIKTTFITIGALTAFLALLTDQVGNRQLLLLLLLLTKILNVIVWILIGGLVGNFVGKLIQKIKDKGNVKK